MSTEGKKDLETKFKRFEGKSEQKKNIHNTVRIKDLRQKDRMRYSQFHKNFTEIQFRNTLDLGKVL